MKKHLLVSALALLVAVTAYMRGPRVLAAPGDINFNLSAYKAAQADAAVAGTACRHVDGTRRDAPAFVINGARRRFRSLPPQEGRVGVLAANVTPEYRRVSRRRIDRKAEGRARTALRITPRCSRATVGSVLGRAVCPGRWRRDTHAWLAAQAGRSASRHGDPRATGAR
jgi:hypothetical protein